jgi:hypothetical protein
MSTENSVQIPPSSSELKNLPPVRSRSADTSVSRGTEVCGWCPCTPDFVDIIATIGWSRESGFDHRLKRVRGVAFLLP